MKLKACPECGTYGTLRETPRGFECPYCHKVVREHAPKKQTTANESLVEQIAWRGREANATLD